MTAIELPPYVLFFVAAALCAVLNGRARDLVLLLTPVLGALIVFMTPLGERSTVEMFAYELVPVRFDELSRLFAYLFHLATFIAVIFSLHLKDKVQHVCGLVYAGSAVGAVLAGDLITLFIFWELMALASTFLIWARRTERAATAGFRYLIVQVLSGVLLLAGAAMYAAETGSLQFNFIGLEAAGGWLILLAFGIKCAFPLMHNWLTDAYPEATPTGTVFLSAFTTKAAVYALARGFPGTELLVYVGAVMTSFPIFYAVIENDLRRVLAYSMINQIGFMVCGIGIGTALAINGAVAHAFNDVIFKGLLMMSMGAVLHMTGRINGSDLGGLYKSMPITTVLCIVGAASISAFPLFSGFVSKSMVMSAALKEGYGWIWVALLFASAGVFHHAGIKIPFFAFFAHDSGIRTTEPPKNMLVAMGISAFLCIGIGCFPSALYSLLPFDIEYTAYDATHVIAQLQVLFFSALAFVWLNLKGMYPPELHSVNLDVEWTYRRLLPRYLASFVNAVSRTGDALENRASGLLQALSQGIKTGYGPRSPAARGWSSATMVLCAALFLGLFLMFYYA